jgi:group I intron endonuclease
MIGIYCILNTVNAHRYIGQSVNLTRRKAYHFTALRHNSHKNSHLQHAFNLYGPGAFVFQILCTASSLNSLDALERHFIALHKSNNPSFGYNSESGGSANHQISIATKQSMCFSQQRRRSNTHDLKDVPHPLHAPIRDQV